MPYDLKEIAAISGMPGLFRLVKPTRAGVIVESLDERGTRSVASARNKVSLLQEISIYTQDYDQTVPLSEVFDRIHQKHGTSLALTHKSDDRDLTAFMGEIIPDYDRDRVYMSDIKKLVQWYHAVSSRLEYQAPVTEEAPAAAEAADTEPKAVKKSSAKATSEAAVEEKPKAKKKTSASDSDSETAAEKPAKKAAKKKE
ncbi:DUF5606 domain-containing protein [Microvirga sp. STR05]|uniref:DUF5606 domain-containing protein n=1 Tax=Hymenobacter duratus TaxID=2771356 RepID=A0ABR8JMY6_9BACT|nr:DUF5606 domain-containing protein [Hymenobacter duratus]MBD2716973.1 DUF5606 domain-containing protein [Hymenobacter duratus]MBR7951889.1 DUF5606 domain-containing protein [Microvirga sp. STR05]